MDPRSTRGGERTGLGEGEERGRGFHVHPREHMMRIHEMHAAARKDVEFKEGGAGIAVAGVLGGVAFALGATWIVLAHGAALGTSVQTTLVVLSLSLGGLVVLVSAFFGLVIPHHVRREPGEWPGLCGPRGRR